VYIFFRFNSWINFNFVEFILLFRILFISILTIYVYDIKKLIAFSTLRNMALIIYLININIYIYIYIYIIIHALFKSIIFLCIGIIIYLNFDFQDTRLVSSLIFYYPLLAYVFISCLFIRGGILFISIFYCKDLIFDLLFLIKLNNFFFFFFFFVFLSFFSLKKSSSILK
jgi:NADH-ubiquinone oxidoreductase chain 5